MQFQKILDMAARDLPPGYAINITIEKGVASVQLLDDTGDEIPYAGNNDDLEADVMDAIRTAREQTSP